MCGIAGILFKHAEDGLETGKALIDMLDGCQHRGPDSTGFALYGAEHADELRLRFFVGEGEAADDSVRRIKQALGEHQARIIEDQCIGNNYRARVAFRGDLQKFSYAMEHAAPGAKVISIGESLEIVKDVGSAHRGAPSQCEMLTRPGFSSPNQPDEEGRSQCRLPDQDRI